MNICVQQELWDKFLWHFLVGARFFENVVNMWPNLQIHSQFNIKWGEQANFAYNQQKFPLEKEFLQTWARLWKLPHGKLLASGTSLRYTQTLLYCISTKPIYTGLIDQTIHSQRVDGAMKTFGDRRRGEGKPTCHKLHKRKIVAAISNSAHFEHQILPLKIRWFYRKSGKFPL